MRLEYAIFVICLVVLVTVTEGRHVYNVRCSMACYKARVCPRVHPSNQTHCADNCGSDSDCVKSARCCSNECGGKTCKIVKGNKLCISLLT